MGGSGVVGLLVGELLVGAWVAVMQGLPRMAVLDGAGSFLHPLL